MPPGTSNVIPPSSSKPICFLDILIGKEPAGRLTFELFADECPKTAENFRALCTGEKSNERGRRLHYKNSTIHAAHAGWCIVGGDIVNKNGTMGESIYGPYFPDENHSIPHDRPYLLSMMNFKNGTNSSQFIISLCAAPSMDGQYPAFGRLISGAGILQKMVQHSDQSGFPTQPITIAECGQLSRVRRISSYA